MKHVVTAMFVEKNDKLSDTLSSVSGVAPVKTLLCPHSNNSAHVGH